MAAESGGAHPAPGGDHPPPGGSRPAPGDDRPAPEREPLLLEAVLSLGTDLELRTALQDLVTAATRLTDARYGALGVVDPERSGGPRLTELFTVGLDEAAKARIGDLPCGDKGVLGALLRDPRPLRVDDLAADPRSCGTPAGHPPMHSFLGVPVLVRDEVFGDLYLTEKRGGGPFTAEDERLVRILAAQAGIAIGNALLFENARQRERWIEGAAAVTTALLSGARSDDPLLVVAEQARLLADADAGVILQPTEEGGMEIVTASTHGDPADLVGATIAPGSPVLEQLLGGEPVFVDDSATDPRMTTHVRSRFGPSLLLPLQSGGRLIGTLALPRTRGARGYTSVERQLAGQFASQAALALVLADARRSRERLAVFEDRDRIARDLHDLVVQRLFATGMMLESTQRRAVAPEIGTAIGKAVDELESTIQEVRTAIFALQQPPVDAPTSLRGKVLKEAAGAAAVLGVTPSTQFRGAVDSRVPEPVATRLLAALHHALAAAARRPNVSEIRVHVDADARLPDGRPGLILTVDDDGGPDGTTATSQWPL
ncbi:GAF domain-containing protein [Streptomyces cavernicola]|uniref:GAF domain-containing protein n=1 Tax=Streptomyces cavernicola TaxID=3043613 RepID=A0ABT6SK11_9ACTN|nr:GAF domain-containing protein [Streptomyces sp. B-S-A6]MDI3408285.1 GAF domain-containing protein [Streptomyces sp. B-S-A6]